MRPLSLLALLLLGCDASRFDERERAELQAGDVQIPLGETADLAGLAVRFDEVVDDSRCPLDAICVWEGEARVALTIDGDAADLRVVDPALEPDAGVRAGGVVVFAVGLAPFPRVEDPSAETPVVAVTAIAAEE